MAMSQTVGKFCFVVSQIGEESSPERVSADWFLEAIVRPVFEKHFPQYVVRRADGIPGPGMIDGQMISHIIDADIVIADLTNVNPNVFYEIGLRHMVQKPIIHMHEQGTKIPFDVSLFRSFKYSRSTPRELADACKGLEEAVRVVVSPSYEVENPVTRTLGMREFKQHASPSDKIIANELETLKAQMREYQEIAVRTFQANSLDSSKSSIKTMITSEIGQDIARIQGAIELKSEEAFALNNKLNDFYLLLDLAKKKSPEERNWGEIISQLRGVREILAKDKLNRKATILIARYTTEVENTPPYGLEQAIGQLDEFIDAKRAAGQFDRDYADVLYNRACYASRLFAALEGPEKARPRMRALSSLAESVKIAPVNAEEAAGDHDFVPLRDDPEFQKIVGSTNVGDPRLSGKLGGETSSAASLP